MHLRPAARQFVEELFVESLVGFFGAHRQEDVATDEFVHHLAVGRQATENHVLLLKLDHHVFHFPVDVPRLCASIIHRVNIRHGDLVSLWEIRYTFIVLKRHVLM